MLRKVLIADDNRVNRQLLRKILSEDYQVIEAENGREALAVLDREHEGISAVLLDIIMPEMDGYGALERIRRDERLAQIPVIVITGETDEGAENKALSLGANDFVTKPYNPEVIRRRLWNAINLRETSVEAQSAQRDYLTGLYNRKTFFKLAAERIAAREPGHYVLACFDINNFKVINDQYGSEKGDEVLKTIANVFARGFSVVGGLCSRITADNFAVLYPCSFMDTPENEQIRHRATELDGSILPMPVSFSIGRYIVDDLSLPVSAMYDRAVLAESSVKGRYDTNIALYDESMREKLLRQQEIVNEMNGALENRHFEVWLQPQYNHASGALIGAEALVRWRHPKKGLIFPGDFIPVFEKNGFIYELDKYVWEETCRLLRKWLDAGRSPLPLSVNISRYDVFREDMTEVLTGFLEKYKLPPQLLRLEITESAFAKSTAQIISVVKRLTDYGFTMEIDDFGSGYSSLNTLKDVPADVVKLDMRLLESDVNSQRGGNILESIVRMAKWLDMSVIAEGVETMDQAEYLRSIGCNYIQGYLYARPMPVEEYEQLAGHAGKEEKFLTIETVENLNNNAFWDPKSIDTLIFNSYVGGACIFEYHNGNIEMLRATKKYAQVIGSAGMTVEDALKLNWAKHLDEENSLAVKNAIQQSVETKDEVTCEYVFLNLPGCPEKTYLRSTLRVIAVAGSRCLIYCTNENITAAKLAEKALSVHQAELETAISKMGRILCEYDVAARTLTMPEAYAAKHGKPRVMEDVPRSINRFAGLCEAVLRGEPTGTVEVEFSEKDGTRFWERAEFSTIFDENGAPVKAIIAIEDTTEQHRKYELEQSRPTLGEKNLLVHALFNLSTGETLDYAYQDGNPVPPEHRTAFLHGRDDNLETLIIDPDERREYRALNDPAILLEHYAKGKTELSIDYRRQMPGGELLWVRNILRMVREPGGSDILLFEYCYNIDEEKTMEMVYRSLMDSNYDYVLRVNGKTGHYVMLNNPQREYIKAYHSGPDINAAVSELAEKRIHPDDRRTVLENLSLDSMKRNLETADRFQFTCREMQPDGSVRYKKSTQYYLDRARDIIIITREDVTPIMQEEIRKNQLLEEALKAANEEGRIREREAAAQLQTIMNNVNGGMSAATLTDGKINYIYVNDEYFAMFGYTREQFYSELPRGVVDIIHPDDLQMVYDAAAEGETTGRGKMEFRASRRDGSLIWVRSVSSTCHIAGVEAPVHIAVLIDITKEREAETHLRMSREQFRIAASLGNRNLARYDIKTGTYYNDSELLQRLGFSEVIENVPQAFLDKGVVDPDCVQDMLDFYERLRSGRQHCSVTTSLQVPDGSFRWFRLDATVTFDEEGQPAQAVLVFFDITEQREKEAVYKKWQQSLQEKAPEAYTLFCCNMNKDASFDSMEGSLLRMKFKPGPASFNQRTLEYAEACVHPEDRDAYIAVLNSNALLAAYYRGKRTETMEYREMLPDGQIRWLRLTVELVEYPESTDIAAYLMYEDIDAQKRAELRNKERAETDPLTGLLNRAAFSQAVEQLIAETKGERRHALLMLDIDGFKQVNDTFGHGAGDQTLIDTANSLRSILRRRDLLGRLGGDEFVVFLKDVPDKIVVAKKAGQICELLRRSFSPEVNISASVGIAMCPRDGVDFDTLYRKVDIALYRVKGGGKDGYAFYSSRTGGAVCR